MALKNPWNNTSAGVAIALAFLVGIVGALSLREGESQGAPDTLTEEGRGSLPSVHWRVPTAFGTNLPAVGDNVVRVAREVAEATRGRIILEVFEPGMLIPPFSITEGVGAHKIEAGYTWLGYDHGKVPAAPLVSAVPFGMEPWEFAAWYFEDDGKAFTEALYHPINVHPILCSLVGPETAGWFRQPIESLDDFNGLKIRFAGLGGRVMQKLGASVTLLPGGEIFQALEKGAIDATEFSMPAVDQLLGFDRIAKFNYFPGWHQTFSAGHLVVNLDVWNDLADADKMLLNLACTAGALRNLSRGESIQGAVISGFPAKGVTASKFSLPILRELERITQEVLQGEADSNEDFSRIWASQKAFRKTYRAWKDHAYLPRDF